MISLLIITSCSGGNSPVVVGCDTSSACFISLNREQTRNLRSAVSVIAALSAMCSEVSKVGICQAIGLGGALSAEVVNRIYEDGNCFELEFQLSAGHPAAVFELPNGTRNCV